MKAIVKLGMMKAIAFMAVAIFFISCFTSCCPDEPVLTKAVVTIQAAENVTESSATLVAMLTPNTDKTSLVFRYKVAGTSNWQTVSSEETYSGSNAIKVTCPVNGLVVGTRYDVEANASNAAGPTSSELGSFTTPGYVKAIATVTAISEVKIDSATISFESTPNQDNSTVVLEWQVKDSDWQSKVMGTNFSGTSSVKFSWTLTGLQANTNYNVRVKTTNKAGEVVSTVLSFMTYAVRDWDGNLYHTVTMGTKKMVDNVWVIGTSVWLKENFRGTHYANGDPIANVTDLNKWVKLTTGAYCWYNNDKKIGDEYGGLYNWYVGVDSRGLIPGWHTPTNNEFVEISVYLDNSYQFLSGSMMMEKGSAHWNEAYTYRVPTNSSGFTALGNGNINTDQIKFLGLKDIATFWGADEAGIYASAIRILNTDCIFNFNGYYGKNEGYALRLTRNN